eukprot:GHVS01100669.1.p1 GENE.GHVS01100669.1~~GHVS01100669.1.p1  ORF type:complete len:123 (+),score=10.93 GHVS01100669.1:3-371(+)
MEAVFTLDGAVVKSSMQTMMMVKEKGSDLGYKVRYLSKIEGITEGGRLSLPYDGYLEVNKTQGVGWSVTELRPGSVYNLSQMSVLEGHPASSLAEFNTQANIRSFVDNFFRKMMTKEISFGR